MSNVGRAPTDPPTAHVAALMQSDPPSQLFPSHLLNKRPATRQSQRGGRGCTVYVVGSDFLEIPFSRAVAKLGARLFPFPSKYVEREEKNAIINADSSRTAFLSGALTLLQLHTIRS